MKAAEQGEEGAIGALQQLDKIEEEEQHPCSFQNSFECATCYWPDMIHQSTNSDHATDVTEFITVEKNVKEWNIGRKSWMDTKKSCANIHM